MIQDDAIWQIINNGHCAYKSKTVTQTFCRNEYNLTGMCNRHSCPLANSRYATVLEHKSQCYLYLKTIERAHLPNQLWEKIKLPKNYQKALEVIDETIEFWGKFQRHKCKQRLTKLHQMIIRKRKLKISSNHTQEVQVRINKKYEKREKNREASALKAAQVERAIEKELLNRLKVGTFYKNIYNLDKKEFDEKLNELEVPDQTQYEVDEENENEDIDEEEDDSVLGGDLLIGEDEMDDDERELLKMAQLEDQDSDSQDIEDIGEKQGAGKKRGFKSVGSKKPVQIGYEEEVEYEYEREDLPKKSGKKVDKLYVKDGQKKRKLM